jgi:hypothetical protein
VTYSWEINTNEYKYETIQHGYESEYFDEEPIELSLDEMLEINQTIQLENEGIELEELLEAI